MKKKILLWILLTSVVAVAGVLIRVWAMFGTFVTAARSIEKIEEGLYALEYRGDYGLDEFLAKGGAASDKALAQFLMGYFSRGYYKPPVPGLAAGEFGCSTVCRKSAEGQVLFGRNFDWKPCTALLVHSVPKKGYESFSTSCVDFLGFGKGYVPDGTMTQRFMALAALYVPLDGMNEKGLIVADLMAGDNEATHQRTGKVALTTTAAIRLLLDRAANVDEALALLAQYDMHSSIASAHHFALADATGKSVVVEWVDNEMRVKETPFVTNHYLTECAKKGTGSRQSHRRFEALAAAAETTDAAGVMAQLESVSKAHFPSAKDARETTMWSLVYEPSAQRANFSFNANYSRVYRLGLGAGGRCFWEECH